MVRQKPHWYHPAFVFATSWHTLFLRTRTTVEWTWWRRRNASNKVLSPRVF